MTSDYDRRAIIWLSYMRCGVNLQIFVPAVCYVMVLIVSQCGSRIQDSVGDLQVLFIYSCAFLIVQGCFYQYKFEYKNFIGNHDEFNSFFINNLFLTAGQRPIKNYVRVDELKKQTIQNSKNMSLKNRPLITLPRNQLLLNLSVYLVQL